jgi:hypothetical protein
MSQEIDATNDSGFAAGAALARSEPAGHAARGWSFVEAAGRLVPSIQAPSWALGYASVRGEAPWRVPLVEGLEVGYLIELDFGVCALTEAQMRAWGVTADRVTSAARSLLFHKTWAAAPVKEQFWEVYAHPDGHNAARALILADIDYARARAGILFALPEPGALMVIDRGRPPEARARFAQRARQRHKEAAQPLSAEIYTLEGERVARWSEHG